MHSIRKQTDKEVNVIDIQFKLPVVLVVLYLLVIIASAFACYGGIAILRNCQINEAFDAFGLGIFVTVVGGFITVLTALLLIFRIIGFKESHVTVSNQRIFGKYGLYIFKKTFSYRLDEIDNIEVGDMLGSHSLSINFQQGKGPQSAPVTVQYGNTVNPLSGFNCLKLRCVENYQEVYDKLNEMLLSLKNQIDLETDIAMANVDAQNRQASAIEKMADNISNGRGSVLAATPRKKGEVSYIDEIKELKNLYDSGAITKEEFEQEKKEILNSNHK